LGRELILGVNTEPSVEDPVVVRPLVVSNTPDAKSRAPEKR
jgi:hypothetical protein